MTFKVGITGGIGSGKSVVCKIFKTLGIPVFEADAVAKQLTNTNPEIKEQLIDLYGEGIYSDDGTINRKKLAGIIFNDDIELRKVNEIIHPEVRNYFFEWAVQQNSAYVVHEAAILFESGFYKLMDYNVAVLADQFLRIERVIYRDGSSFDEVKERIDKQWSDEKRNNLADAVIYNNSELLIPQVLETDKKIRQHGNIR